MLMENRKTIIVAFIAVALVIGSLWFTNRAVTPKEATWEDVLVEAKAGGYGIIKTQDLWDRYQKDSTSILLVDTRQEWEYRTGHLKGALNFPIEPTWYSRWRKQKPLETFLGTDKNRFIVFY
ncbi:MAG: rhodanese-like domain-containing protein [Deltaproteobacteria bacterium]|nr:rhodanese-like domain-containing protein [Deltaproteobacteria bacterium]